MRALLTIFLIICFAYIGLAQECDPPAPPSNICQDAPVVCDLQGWCGNSGGYTPTSQPNAFCGIVENNCWVSFRAYTTFLEIDVTTSNCNNGQGVQVHMFYTEDCAFFESVSNCLDPVPPNSTRTLVANGLTPGTIYHIMVDGKNFDFCDFTFDVVAGRTSPLADLQGEYVACEKDTFLLGESIYYIDAYSYFWSTEDGNFITSPDGPTTSVDSTGTYVITVIDKEHGCIDTATIVVINPPPINIELEAPDTLDCGDNMNVVLDASNSDFGENYSIEWLRFDGDSLAPQLFHDDIAVPGLYYATITSQYGCTVTDSIEIVSGVDFPVANAGLSAELNCLNETVYLDGSNSSINPIFTYEWLTPNGNIISATNELIIEVDEPGVYNLIVTNSENDCWSGDPVLVELNDAIPTGAETTIENPCFGETDGSINIVNVEGGIPPYTYALDSFQAPEIPFYQNLAPGNYPLTITDQTGCTWDTILNIAVPEPILLNLGADRTIELGEELTVNTNLNRPMEQIFWTPNPDSTILNSESHTFVPLQDQTYVVQALDDNNCVEVDEITIQVLEKEKVYIPSAFSPNADGLNDVFMVFAGKDVAQIKRMAIFDRWGELLFDKTNFQANDPTNSWDGFFRNKQIDPQVLVYMVEVEFINGKEKLFAGDVTIMY